LQTIIKKPFAVKVHKEPYENHSGFNTDWPKYIITIEPNQYRIDEGQADSNLVNPP